MKRIASVMFVNPDCHEEYQRRHAALWDEMKEVLRSHGAHNYSIHLFAEQNLLFAYVEVDSQEQWDAIADTDVCKKWWAYMKDVMPSNPDNSPVTKSLKEVFYLQ